MRSHERNAGTAPQLSRPPPGLACRQRRAQACVRACSSARSTCPAPRRGAGDARDRSFAADARPETPPLRTDQRRRARVRPESGAAEEAARDGATFLALRSLACLGISKLISGGVFIHALPDALWYACERLSWVSLALGRGVLRSRPRRRRRSRPAEGSVPARSRRETHWRMLTRISTAVHPPIA